MQSFLRAVGLLIRTVVAVAAVVIVVAAFAWVFVVRPLRGDALLPGQVQLRVVHWGANDEADIVANLIRQFEATHPNIKILRIHPGEAAALNTKVQTMVAAGEPPDAFYLDYAKVADWASKGILQDLERFVAEDATSTDPHALHLDDYYRNVIDSFRYDGERVGAGPLYGIAKDFTTVGFYYNKDLFKRAGIAEPNPEGWTWGEFVEAARKVGEVPGCFGAEFVTWEAMVRVYLWTYHLDVVTPGFGEFRFQDAAVQAALARLQDWFFEERTLTRAKAQLETGEDPFLSGKVGMTGPLGRWKVPPYRTITDFEWDFAPLPHAEGVSPRNAIFTAAWAMSAQTAHPQETWEFIRFMVGREGQELITGPALAIPTMKSVAESPLFIDPAKSPRHDEVYLDAVPDAAVVDWPANPAYQRTLRIAIEEIFKIGRPLEPTLARVEGEWQRIKESDFSDRKYPRVNWGLVAAVVLIPLGLAALLGGAWWWRTRPRKLGRQEEVAGLIMIGPWVIGLMLFTAFPIFLSLLLTFSRWSGLTTLGTAEWVGLDNLAAMVRFDEDFHNALVITAFYVLLAVPFGQLVALALAMLMNQEVRGIGVYRAVFYLPSVLAGVGMAVLWKWVFDEENGLLNAALLPVAKVFGMLPPRWFEQDAETWGVPAFVIISLWSVGGSMIIYLAGLKGIPQDLYEAAEIDGAKWLRRVRHVTLPMLSPVILFNVIIAIIASFQVFTQVYVMTGGGPGKATLFYVLYLYDQAFNLHEMGYASGMAWLLLLLVLALTMVVMWGSKKLVYYEALKS